MKGAFSAVFTISIIAFLLHFVWETLHVPLYGGHEGVSSYVPMTVLASLGDVLYTLAAVGLVSLSKGTAAWARNISRSDMLTLAIMGFAIAVFVEYKALVFGKWLYLDSMPIIPYLEVGLSPVAQMTLLLPLSVLAASYVNRYMLAL